LKGRRREKFSDRVDQSVKLDVKVENDGRSAREVVAERLAQLAERVNTSEPLPGTLQALLLRGRPVSEDDETS
jgi:hypothetical protein